MRWWLTRVESWSMHPTLRPGHLYLTGSLRRGAPIRRGDLVVVDSAELGRRVVKRVIGLPGERIGIRGGAVSVDGVALAEPYASASTFRGTFVVPADGYLLLGDNRDASSDSRTWRRPYVPLEQIVGRIVRPPAGRVQAGSAQAGPAQAGSAQAGSAGGASSPRRARSRLHRWRRSATRASYPSPVGR